MMILLFRRALITDQVKDADDSLRAYLNYGNLLLSSVGITSGLRVIIVWVRLVSDINIRPLIIKGSLVSVAKLPSFVELNSLNVYGLQLIKIVLFAD